MATALANAAARLRSKGPRCKVGKYYDALSAGDKEIFDEEILGSDLPMRTVYDTIKTVVPFGASAYRAHALQECRCH